MGSRILATSIIGILFVSMVCSFSLMEDVSGEEAESDLQSVALYLYGSPDNATLNTSYTNYEEQHVLTTGPTDVPMNPIPLGEWESKPISYPMNIEGEIGFMMSAKGNLAQVRFTAYLTVNDVPVSDEMITDRQDLNESISAVFMSNTVNTSALLELDTNDTIGLSLSLDHNDIQYYQPDPIPGNLGHGKNVTLVFGWGSYSFVVFPTNSMRITDITGEDDPDTGNMIVTATIKCSFGTEDFSHASAWSEYGKFYLRGNHTVVDDATVEVDWDWDYTVGEGGSYPVRITAKDWSGNSWKLTEDVHITTPYTEIDFSVESSDISFLVTPKINKNTTIEAKITGSGKRWDSYQVEIEFYDGASLIDTITAKVSRGKTNIASVLWEPDTTGTHAITVIIDPHDDFQETDESNNEATKNMDVKDSNGDGTPGFESLFVLVAMGVALIVGMRSRRAR